MSPKDKDENAKAPAFKTPVNLPSVDPSQYPSDIDSGNGSAKAQPGKRES